MKDFEAVELYALLLIQQGLWATALHEALGTHKSAEPVSTSTWNSWGGVPMEILAIK